MTRTQTPDPLETTCPVCQRRPGQSCLAVDRLPLPTPHPERGAGTPMYDALLAGA